MAFLPWQPGYPAARPDSRHTGPVSMPLASSSQHQIAEGEQGEQLRLVPGQSLVANLPVAEEVLDDMKRVLDLGADAGLGLLDRQQQRFHGTVFHLLDGAAFGGDTAAGVRGILLFVQVLPHAGVARVAVYPLVILPDQSAGHGDIGDVGRRGGDTVGQSGDRIDTDMGLHAEVILLALPGLLHLRIALPGLVPGGGGRRHNGGVDDGALAHEQALLGQVGVDFLEDPLGQGMLLQQVTEAQQRGRIRHTLDGQIDTDEVTHGLAVVDGILQRFIGQGIPLLQKVNAQHALQANGWSASLAR